MSVKSSTKPLVSLDKRQAATLLRDNKLLQNLTPAQWQQVLLQGHLRHIPLNTTVLWQGKAPTAVYIVLRGTVKVFCTNYDRSDTILAVCGPGELLGEMSAVDGEPISANVTTLENSLFWVMERDAFLDCLRTMPEMSLNLVCCTMRRLRTLSLHVQLLSRLDITGRIAAQLLAFAEDYGVTEPFDGATAKGTKADAPNAPIFLPLRLKQSDLSDLLGASRVRVNQVLNNFRRQGFIQFDSQRQITICRPDKLEELCR